MLSDYYYELTHQLTLNRMLTGKMIMDNRMLDRILTQLIQWT
jgi:hypothetical protein